MPRNELTFKIGGEAGQGIESSAGGFALALARAGLHVFDWRDYRSRVRGGHNFAQIRISEEPITSHREQVHVLLAMTDEAIRQHFREIDAGGCIIYDDQLQVDAGLVEQIDAAGVQRFAMPLEKLAEEVGGSVIMTNTAAVAAAAGVTDLPLSYIEGIIRQNFKKKGDAVIDANLKVAEAAYKGAAAQFGDVLDHKITPIPDAPQRMLINGNQAFALGALAGGCRFVAGYPMTPGSPVLEWMAAHANKYGVVVKHTEDEIAAACMAIGAGHVGARAMVPTSGGGFSLMVEALGWAGMSETPVVFYNAQRPGPSTGLPTRHEQGDLMFSIWASQGEFARLVLAPGTIEESFTAGYRSLNLAEIYQTPVIVLSDHFLATSSQTVEMDALNLNDVEIDRGKLLSDEELDRLTGEYLRYALAEDGISPRALPGHPNGVYVAEGNEHDESGHIVEEIVHRNAQHEKRLQKLETARRSIRPPQRFGPENAPVSLIGWGSTIGPALEALKIVNAERPTAHYWHISDIWPFPAREVGALIANANMAVVVEGNALSQLARLIQQETGFRMDHHILRYDGRAFSPEYIVRGMKEVFPDA